MSTVEEYTVSELATLAGVTTRTIRYYVSIGLLASPGQVGPGTRYGEGHLARLRLIRRLQREHLPLGEIALRLEGLDDAAVEAALAADESGLARRPGAAAEMSIGPAPGSALEYIRNLKEAQRRTPSGPLRSPLRERARMPAPLAAHPDAASLLSAPLPSATAPLVLAKGIGTSAPEAEDAAALQRSQWERVTLGPNVELHVRRPLSRIEQKQVERLIRLGRELLEGGKPA
jgi:DNA-binding transcriptional MerR regulator